MRSSLLSKKPIDTSPLWWELRGELSGGVGDPTGLAETDGPLPHPCVDRQITLDDAQRTSDQTLRLSPRHTVTVRVGEGVQLTPTEHRAAVGLNDAEMFQWEPPPDEATLVE